MRECKGADCNECGMLCRLGREIDESYAGRLAFMLECAILDLHGHFDAACALLDEYKAEWEKVNPSPPTFMGEPIQNDRKGRLIAYKATSKSGETAHFGEESTARAWARSGTVEVVNLRNLEVVK